MALIKVGDIVKVTLALDREPRHVEVPGDLARYIAQKGSVAIDGVSLTVNEVDATGFGVNIIPHTWDVTTLGALIPGAAVHIEIDMLARYVARLREVL